MNDFPLSQKSFENYLDTKYVTQQNLFSTHHYETVEIKDSSGFVFGAQGLEVEKELQVQLLR